MGGTQAGKNWNCGTVVDLTYGWSDNHSIVPATELNGSYTGHSFSDRAVQLVRDHPSDLTKPLFLYLALHSE